MASVELLSRRNTGYGPRMVAPVSLTGSGPPEVDLLRRWQRYLEISGRANPRTRRVYRRIVVSFLADIWSDDSWGGPRDAFSFTEDDAVAYIGTYTVAQGQQRQMVIRALRSYYAFCADRQAIERSPMRHLRPKDPKLRPAPSLTVADLSLECKGV